MTTPDPSDDFQTASGSRSATLEDLRQWLQLNKLTVIRGGWKFPENFKEARRSYQESKNWPYNENTQNSYQKKVRKNFDEQLDVAAESLRDFVAQQNAATAEKLSPNDLRSLLRFGHVTLREGNTQQVSQVIVFDPIENGAQPDRDWAIEQLVDDEFFDSWAEKAGESGQPKLKITDFIENFDVDPQHLYGYQVALRVHYALTHQNQLVSIDSRMNQIDTNLTPHFLRFAGLVEDNSHHEYQPYLSQREKDEASQTRAERAAFEYLNYYSYKNDEKPKDKNFYAKMVRLESLSQVINAVAGMFSEANVLRRLSHEPGYDYARYYPSAGDAGLDPKGISKEERESIQKDLFQKLRAAVNGPKSDKPENIVRRLMDPRVTIPAFRQVYEADDSKGAQRAFLTIIKEGLTRYFPTLYAASIPGPGPDQEPPQTLAGYRERKGPSPAPGVPHP